MSASPEDPKSATASPTVSSASPGALAQALASTKSTSSTNVRHRSPSGAAPKALLSCELCRTRKIKCDKADGGCSNCRKAGVKCIALNRQRLPRGRNGGRKKADAELKARVGRLENLVRTLESTGDGRGVDDAVKWLLTTDEKEIERIRKSTEGTLNTAPKDMSRFLSSSFWSNLSSQVNGLRDILDDDSDADDEDDASSGITGSNPSSGEAPFSFVLCGPDSLVVGPEASQHPPRFMAQALCAEYGRNVTTVFNILHYPSLSSFLIDEKPYLNYPRGHPSTEALSFAVYLIAIVSKPDEDCQRDFGQDKRSLMKAYRFRLEAALSRADFVNTRDLTVLQALMLLLIAARAQDNSRFTWTMLGLAVRIAQDMGLHEDDTLKSFTPFEHEMRRRVWNALCCLDFQAVKDRGSSPLIPINSFTTPPPLNINDEEISPSTKGELKTRDGMTSMSLNIVSGYAARVGKQLNFVPRGDNGRPPTEIEQNWDIRQQIVISFRQEYEEHFGKYADPSNPRDVGVRIISEVIARCLLLGAVRPLERHPKSNPPKISGTNLLNLTSTMLEQILIARNNPEWRSFTWFGALYNQWHPLAVMAAELCVNTEGPAVDRAWAVVEPAMSVFRVSVADSERGMLWRPIEKMMKRARDLRRRKLESLGMPVPISRNSSISSPPVAVDDCKQMGVPDQQLSFKGLGSFPSDMNSVPNMDMDFSNLPDEMMTGQFMEQHAFGNGSSNIWNQWNMSPSNMDLGIASVNSESPGVGWDNWENFVQDIDQTAAPDPMFDVDMQLYNMRAFGGAEEMLQQA